MQLGVIEGFFGPAWPLEARLSYASFLKEWGGDYYIYAPKQDPHLRKQWREAWDNEYLSFLENMRDHFHSHGIRFGVALSPFGLGERLSPEDQLLVEEKLSLLTGLKIDMLGVFFDDMPVQPNLASVQKEVMSIFTANFRKQIVFCPTFYCFDPILEKVFGKKPDHYLENIASYIPPEVDLAWTGPKVISPEIPLEHLQEVRSLLKRKPFIWENLFANDGPRNCKFLKLRPFDGRSGALKGEVSSWGFNMMNQPELSKITFLASLFVLKGDKSPEAALAEAMASLVTPEFARFLGLHRKEFLEEGLDKLPNQTREDLLHELEHFKDPAAREVTDWLKGKYLVGSECLTD